MYIYIYYTYINKKFCQFYFACLHINILPTMMDKDE